MGDDSPFHQKHTRDSDWKGFYHLPQVTSRTPRGIVISARKGENVVVCEVIKTRPGSGLYGFLSPESW